MVRSGVCILLLITILMVNVEDGEGRYRYRRYRYRSRRPAQRPAAPRTKILPKAVFQCTPQEPTAANNCTKVDCVQAKSTGGVQLNVYYKTETRDCVYAGSCLKPSSRSVRLIDGDCMTVYCSPLLSARSFLSNMYCAHEGVCHPRWRRFTSSTGESCRCTYNIASRKVIAKCELP